MLRKKYDLYLSETEHCIWVNCLIEIKIKLIHQTDLLTVWITY